MPSMPDGRRSDDLRRRSAQGRNDGWMFAMDALIEILNAKLSQWKPEMAAQVREHLTEIISLADQDALDLLRTRAVEQEVLDMLDEPASR